MLINVSSCLLQGLKNRGMSALILDTGFEEPVDVNSGYPHAALAARDVFNHYRYSVLYAGP